MHCVAVNDVGVVRMFSCVVCQLMAAEMKKKWKEVPKTFDIPTGLFSVQGGSCIMDLWKWA